MDLQDAIEQLEVTAERGDVSTIIELLQTIVPEFDPQIVEALPAVGQGVTRFRVMVADDDPQQRDIMSSALGREGFEVAAVADGLEVLERLSKVRPHLLVLDLKMPNLDGLSLFEKLKESPATRNIPIMLITGYSELGEGAKGIDFDADDFISKPFRLPEFVVRVKGILHRRYSRRSEPQTSGGEIVREASISG